MNSDAARDIAAWFEEGQRLFGACLERVQRLEELQIILERDKEELRREISRLQHDNEILRTQREEMLATFNALVGHVTQVADQALQRFGRGEPPK